MWKYENVEMQQLVYSVSPSPHSLIFILVLIVTFLTFQTTDIAYSHTIHFVVLYIVMKLLVNAVEFVTSAVAVVEINFCFSVTVYTPAHA